MWEIVGERVRYNRYQHLNFSGPLSKSVANQLVEDLYGKKKSPF